MNDMRHFVKGTIWATTTPMTFSNRKIPVGTPITVCLRRPHFDETPAFEYEWKGKAQRYTIGRERLASLQLIYAPTKNQVWFIRNITTGLLYGYDQVKFIQPGFHYTMRDNLQANTYASLENAHKGMANILKRNSSQKLNPDIPEFDIISYDVFRERTCVHPVCGVWWSNLLRINALMSRKIPQGTKKLIQPIVQRITAGLPRNGGVSWQHFVFAIFSEPTHYATKQRYDRLNEMVRDGGNNYLIERQGILLDHTDDVVLLRLAFPEIETFEL